MNRGWMYPFTAIIGQEEAKKALILTLVNPKIGGVLLAGEKGTAKSTLVRGIVPLLEESTLIELPLHVTEEQMLGGINIEHMMKSGEKRVQRGLLAKADGHVLYVDEVNLLSTNTANIVMEAKGANRVTVAREGITDEYTSNFILVGTMNPEEGMLPSKFLDRFGLFVQVRGEMDVEARKQIIQSRLQFERDREAFFEQQKIHLQTLREKIQQAKRSIDGLAVLDDYSRLAVEISLQANCEGHRADLLLIETAKAIAAFNGEITLTFAHLEEAARFVLPHRMRQNDEQSAPEKQQQEPQQSESDQQSSGANNQEPMNSPDMTNESEQVPEEGVAQETVDMPQGQFNLSLLEPPARKEWVKREGNGKRTVTKTSQKKGRYVKSIYPKGSVDDIAFDATLRVAALYQKNRQSDGQSIVIHSSDIRQKVREKRTGKVILFVVDTSGSMGVKKRMSVVKSAILSLLQEAYEKRDKVGLITFSNDEAKILLEPTRSIDLADKKLRDVPTGGNTPLALGLEMALHKLNLTGYKEPDYAPFLVLITDGRANSTQSTNGWQESLEACQKIQSLNIKSMVMDTESGFIQLGLAKELARELEATYYKMGDINATSIVEAITAL